MKKKWIVLFLIVVILSLIAMRWIWLRKEQPAATKNKSYQTDLLVYTTDNSQKQAQDILAHAGKINQVSIAVYTLTPTGVILGQYPNQIVSAAHETETSAFACIDLYKQKDLQLFMQNEAYQKKAIENINNVLKNGNYQGVNIDFENVSNQNSAQYVLFLKSLKKTLQKAHEKLIVSLPAQTEKEKNGYDQKEIGSIADEVVLMAYDDAYGGSPPGAIAPTQWVEKVIEYTVSQIPSSKVLLGVNAYGYDWGSGPGIAVPLRNIPILLQTYHVTPGYNNTADAPYFHYMKNGVLHTVYYENEKSLEDKLNLVKTNHLHGIAIWRTGLEGETLWQSIKMLKK